MKNSNLSKEELLPLVRAKLKELLVSNLNMEGVTPDQIGIITPYEGQRAHVLATMQRSGPMRQV